MTLEKQLHRLAERVTRARRADPVLARALQAALRAVPFYTRVSQQAERTAEILCAVFEALERLEQRTPRVLPTDADIVAAVAEHGGIRPAARALDVNPSTVSRRMARVLHATPTALPEEPLASIVESES